MAATTTTIYRVVGDGYTTAASASPHPSLPSASSTSIHASVHPFWLVGYIHRNEPIHTPTDRPKTHQTLHPNPNAWSHSRSHKPKTNSNNQLKHTHTQTCRVRALSWSICVSVIVVVDGGGLLMDCGSNHGVGEHRRRRWRALASERVHACKFR